MIICCHLFSVFARRDLRADMTILTKSEEITNGNKVNIQENEKVSEDNKTYEKDGLELNGVNTVVNINQVPTIYCVSPDANSSEGKEIEVGSVNINDGYEDQ